MDCSPPDSSVHGILQARILEWSRHPCHALFQGIFLTQASNLPLLCLLHWQAGSLTLVPPGKPHPGKSLLYFPSVIILFLPCCPDTCLGIVQWLSLVVGDSTLLLQGDRDRDLMSYLPREGTLCTETFSPLKTLIWIRMSEFCFRKVEGI